MIVVSVVVLTKNRSSLLRQALLSIQRQTYKNFEVVLVNDGSTDDTQEVIHEFESRLPLRVLSHAESQGINKSRNEAVKAATGEYVAFLDDDDEWVDGDKLKKQVDYFEKNSSVVLVGGGVQLITNYQLPISNEKIEIKNLNIKMRPETDNGIRKVILLKNPFFTSTVMARRKAILDAGMFTDDGRNYTEDYELWLKLGQYGTFYNFQEVFTKYRVPSYTAEVKQNFLKKQAELVKKYGKQYPYYQLAVLGWHIRLLLYPVFKY